MASTIMDVYFYIFLGFIIFILSSICKYYAQKNERPPIYSTPVEVTSECHQVPGQATFGSQHMSTPVIYTQAPYYQPTAPYPMGSSVSATSPPVPHPNFNQSMMNPPSYEEAVSGCHKQPYNPGYPTGQ